MIALLVAIIYHYAVHSIVISRSREGSAIARLSAIVETALWVSVAFGGIFFAFE
jgi:hypothetical protein